MRILPHLYLPPSESDQVRWTCRSLRLFLVGLDVTHPRSQRRSLQATGFLVQAQCQDIHACILGLISLFTLVSVTYY